MKYLSLIISIFIINSCGGDSVGSFIVKDSLQKSSYYVSDSCYDGREFAKYDFFDKTYKKSIYKNENLNEITSSNKYKIEYLNMLQISLYEDDKIADCTVAQNDEHSLTLLCLNRELKDSGNSYNFTRTIWDSKELAIENKDYDCEN